MEELREIVKMSSDSKVRDEILKLIQVWAHAFRNDSSHRAVQDTVNLMKMEGYKFPVLKESDAMFAADSAPEWADGECCNRCRTQFSMVQRKHHCRNCGQIFCAKCSSKLSTIPKYGIEKEVRVCDDCFDKLNKSVKSGEQTAVTKPISGNTSESPYSGPKPKTETTKTEREIQEEEELQLALALSQSEAESKEREQRSRSLSASSTPYGSVYGGMNSKLNQKNSSSPKKLESSVKSLSSNSIDDPELSRYLNRDFWEQKTLNSHSMDGDSPNPMPSAPQPQQMLNNSTVNKNTLNMGSDKLKDKISNGVDDEMEAFLSSLKSAIEIFVNRINSNQLRGRPIANDSAVQSLFMNITNMHSNLLAYIQQQDESRAHFESLQDKLGQIRDARAALDALREEHREQLRREAEEAELLRQQQMAQKLEIMRKKKQEYLQYQREIALQRMQEQEREMLMRQEQHKYIPVWQHPQQPPPPNTQTVPQMMYSNGPQTGQNYLPYANPTVPQTVNTNANNPYLANNVGPNVQMYGPPPQSAPQFVSGPPPPPQSAQAPQSPHTGAPPPPSQHNTYDMQSMANTLPQIPVNNQMVISGHIPMSGPNPTQSDGSQVMPQQMQSLNNTPPKLVEEPLISFD